MQTLKKTAWLFLFLASAAAAGAQAPSATNQKQIAEIEGKPVYEQAILPKVQGSLLQIENREYEIKKQALDSYINEQVVAEKAKAEGLTPEAWLAREVDAKIPQPTDEAVRAYYLAQPNLQGRPFSQIKEQLRASLRQAEIRKARADYIAELRAKANVQIFLEPPRIHVSYDPKRLLGSPHAPVMIIEFADYQCPFCRGVEPTLVSVLKQFDGKVSLAYRDLPLSQIHPHAELAAEASRCAEEQGKFWPYHDLLMSDPPRLDRNSLLEDARTLHLDEKQFDSCLSSGKYVAAVQQDAEAAEGLGANGTPTFFINGQLLSGDQPASVFEKMIQQDLDSSSSRPQTGGGR